MTLPTNATVRPTAAALARMPDLARCRRGRVLDGGPRAVRVAWETADTLTTWMKTEDLELVDGI